MGLGTLMLLGTMWAPGQTLPADLYPFNQSKMDIPIRYDPAKKSEIRDLLLFVSKNQGETWEQYAVASPDRDTFFAFTAPADGTYWFHMVIVDKQGRRDPADLKKVPAALKVLIDTKSPVIAIRSLDRVGDEASMSWDIQETHPDFAKFQAEYRVGDGSWIPLDAKGSATGMARFRVSQTGLLSVRVQAYDLAGNRSEMTRDLSAPINAIAQNPPKDIQQSSLRLTEPLDIPPPNGGMTTIDPVAAPILPPIEQPVVKLPERQPPVQPPVQPPIQQPAPVEQVSPLAVSGPATHNSTGLPLPNAQVINVARFDVAYDVEQKGPSGVSKAEVWVTRDDGKAWQKWSTTEKTESPLTVDLTARNNPQMEGVYGIKIVLLSGAGLSKGPPLSGDLPDMRVDVDLTPPVVKIYEPIPDTMSKDTMILRWQAVDRNMAAEPITLEWSETQDGPWNSIVGKDDSSGQVGTSTPVGVKRLANSGQYAWKIPANFPTHRVYLRVSARDVAGNIAEARTPSPILVDMNKPVAKIHGIIGAAAQERR